MLKKRPVRRGHNAVRRRFPIAVAATVAAIIATASTVAVVSPADEETPPGVRIDPYTVQWVQPEQVEQNHVDFSRPATYCIVGSNRLGCSLAKSVNVTYTVSADAGLNATYISASLGISESDSITVTANCTAPNAQPGTRLVAYPTETRHYYHVVQEQGDWIRRGFPNGEIYQPFSGFGGTSRFATKWVGIPDGGVYCRVESL